MDYYFEMVQKLKFAVYDVDNETSSLGDDDFLGAMECTLGQVGCFNQYFQLSCCKGAPHSRAEPHLPQLRKFGELSIQEILVVT